jgi:hypothetical protein
MRRRYPTIVGAYGHADQTDTKGCPGTSANMKAIFDGIGGHGRFADDQEAEMIPVSDATVAAYAVDVPKRAGGVQLYGPDFEKTTTIKSAVTLRGGPITGTGYIGVIVGGQGTLRLEFVKTNSVDVRTIAAPPAPPADYPVTVGGKPAGSVTLP